MKYVIIAILLYLAYLFIKRFLYSASRKNSVQPKQGNDRRTRKIDVNSIQDAEFREVKDE
ncbi:MAG TPA: hypothetical protein PKA39_05845 [Ignavibacteria bacterium]|nr:hypothetical protein [Ignavibacteria bacterium]